MMGLVLVLVSVSAFIGAFAGIVFVAQTKLARQVRNAETKLLHAQTAWVESSIETNAFMREWVEATVTETRATHALTRQTLELLEARDTWMNDELGLTAKGRTGT